jgi:hypothetical protein
VEALTDAVGLRALGLGARVINVLNRKIELVLVSFGIAAELTPAIGQDAEKLDIVFLESVVMVSSNRRGGALRHPDRSAPRLGLRFAVGTGHHLSD